MFPLENVTARGLTNCQSKQAIIFQVYTCGKLWGAVNKENHAHKKQRQKKTSFISVRAQEQESLRGDRRN
jgi:hypothetical protein